MKRSLLPLGIGILCCLCLTTDGRASWERWKSWYDGSPGAPWWEFDNRFPGGLIIIGGPTQRVISVGGLFTPRKVFVREYGPDGSTTTRLTYPSAFHTPNAMLDLNYGRGMVKVCLPDAHGLLYVNGEKTPLSGPEQILTTPLLDGGQGHTYHLRAAFRQGASLMIQDRIVAVQAGQRIVVAFDGQGAVRVPLPRTDVKPEGVELLPLPQHSLPK